MRKNECLWSKGLKLYFLIKAELLPKYKVVAVWTEIIYRWQRLAQIGHFFLYRVEIIVGKAGSKKYQNS